MFSEREGGSCFWLFTVGIPWEDTLSLPLTLSRAIFSVAWGSYISSERKPGLRELILLSRSVSTLTTLGLGEYILKVTK